MSIRKYRNSRTVLTFFLMTVLMLPFQNCGEGFYLDESISASRSSGANNPSGNEDQDPGSGQVPAATLAILAPIQGAFVKTLTTLRGSCLTGLDVSLTINDMDLQSTLCVAGQFSGATSLNIPDGPVTLRVEQVDDSGNAVAHQILITKDSVAPVVTITEPLVNAPALTSQSLVVAGSCETGLPVNLSGSLLGSAATANCVNSTFRTSVSATAVNGSYMLIASQSDQAGNSGSVSRNLSVNLPASAPVVRFSTPVANFATRSSITIAGTCTNNLAVRISGAGALQLSQVNCVDGKFQAPVAFSSGDGSKNIIISQTNADNVTGQDSRSFLLDTTPPLVAIIAPAAGTTAESSITISGSCETGRTVSISGAGVLAPSSASCNSAMFMASVNLSAGLGTKVITVNQADAVGNAGTSSRSFSRIAPVLDGQMLYANNCSGCHGALARSNVRNSTANQITSAISNIRQMSSIRLSTAEIEAISRALSGL